MSWLVSTLFTIVAVAGAAVIATAIVLFFPGTNDVSIGAEPSIPAAATSTTLAPAPAPSPAPPSGATPAFANPLVPYRVERGDDLASIAAASGVSVDEVRELNQLAADDEPAIGSVILVPGAGDELTLVPSVLSEDPDKAMLIEVFQRWSAQYQAPPELLMAVAWHETNWDGSRRADDGSVGIAQLTPELAEWIGTNLVGIPLDPSIDSENIQLASAYLGWLLEQTEGDTSASLAAFHDELTSQRNIPWRQDTVEYISAVLALRPVFDPRAAVESEG